MKRPDDPRRNPLTAGERVLSTAVSVAAGIIVMRVTRSLWWGLLAFGVLQVGVNAYLVWRKKGDIP